MTLHAILIPADHTRPIAAVDVTPADDPTAFAAAISCQWIERVTTILTGSHGLVLVVDEEGIYTAPQVHNRRASLLVGPRAHIAGDALVVREDSRDQWCSVHRTTAGMLRRLLDTTSAADITAPVPS